MPSSEVARQYAKAFFYFIKSNHSKKTEKTKTEKKIELILNEWQSLYTFFKKNSLLKKMLFSPLLSKEEKNRILNVCLEKIIDFSISLEVKKFLFFLQKKSRLSLIEKIHEAFQGIYHKEKGISQVRIESSEGKMSSHHIQKWKNFLSQRLKTSVQLECQKNDSLLGGMRVEAGGFTLDDTLNHHFKTLKESVKKAQVF